MLEIVPIAYQYPVILVQKGNPKKISGLNDLLKAQFGLRMQVATQQLSNTSQLKKVRRDIARVKTVMNTKEAK